MKQYTYLIMSVLAAGLTALAGCKNNATGTTGNETAATELTPVKFNADSAYANVVAQCDFGARVPNSEAHRRCGDYLVARFKALGLDVEEQKATFTGWDKNELQGRNIIASYRPEADARIILAAHWDSRPWADEDPDTTKHRQPVMAANDGASGVAVMLEVARLLNELKPAVGVDFVCFDAEDYGAPYWGTPDPDGRDWCLGSQYWARQAAARGYKARYGILLDVVGGRDAQFRYEGFSMRYAEAVMHRLWQTAHDIGAQNLFIKADGGYATDDHLPMNEVAGIPTVDVIPYITGAANTFGATWHTTADTPGNISRENLRLVGQTLLQMLSEEL